MLSVSHVVSSPTAKDISVSAKPNHPDGQFIVLEQAGATILVDLSTVEDLRSALFEQTADSFTSSGTHSNGVCGDIQQGVPLGGYIPADYPCILVFGHEGVHVDVDGDSWSDEESRSGTTPQGYARYPG